MATKCVCCLRDDLPMDPEGCTCGPVCGPCGAYQRFSADTADFPEHLERHHINLDERRYWQYGAAYPEGAA